jgi:hypothetical protein
MPHLDLESIYSVKEVDQEQIDSSCAMRECFLTLAQAIEELVPDSREKSLAQTSLQQACMWASSAIASYPPKSEEKSTTSDVPNSTMRPNGGIR